MKKLILGLLLLTSTAFAQAVGPRQYSVQLGTLISAQTLAASRSFSLTAPATRGYGLLTLYIALTDANNSVTAANMACYGYYYGDTQAYTLQAIDVSAGTGTSYDAAWTKNPSAITSPKSWPWRVDIEGYESVSCTFTNTGGTAADTWTVKATAGTKG